MIKKILFSVFFVAILGLMTPSQIDAQSSPTQKKYENIINTANECKKIIDSNPDLTGAEKIVAKRKCASDGAKELVGEVNSKNTRLYELKTKNMIQCETWHSQYTIATLANFKVLKPVQLANDCIELYNDPIWSYSRNDRLHKLLERSDDLRLFQIAQIKAELTGILSPAKQVQKGIIPSHVDCKSGMILIYKVLTKDPACVNLKSVDKIIQRNWGTMQN